MQKTWSAPVEIKADGDNAGAFTARIATLNVIDKDNDVTIKGAFEGSDPVRVSRFNHASAIRDDLPVGVATIEEVGDQVIAEGQLNLDTPGGLDLLNTLRFEAKNGVASEWSYGFTVEESEDGEQDDQKVRFLRRLKAFEISPVMRGAGLDTATLAVKTATDFGDLPLYDRDYSWASSAALGRVRKWASSDGSGDKETIDWPAYAKAFFWLDPDDDESFGGFKLPFADITDGKLWAVPRGIFAVAGVLQGARGGVDISEVEQTDIRSVVDKYYSAMREKFDDDSIIVPWAKSAGGLSMKHEGDLVLASLDAYTERVALLAELRLKEGRALSAANRKRLESMVESVASVTADIGTILETTKPQEQSKPVNPLADHAAFMATLARISQE
jgi:phage head maturation protease